MDLRYYKPLLLPSNGKLYKNLVHICEPDVSFMIRMNSAFLSLNESDFLFSIIKRFTSFENPEDLLFRDAYYIWIYFYSFFAKEESMRISGVCDACEERSSVNVELSKFKTKPLSDEIESTICINDWEITYSKRLLKHNIKTAFFISELEDRESVHVFSSFVKPQITGMKKDGKSIDLQYVDDMILDIGVSNLKKLFDAFRTEDWGLPDFFEYICPQCKDKAKAFLCDPLRSSVYMEDFEEKKSEMFENALIISSTKTVSFSDILSIPISSWEEFVSHIDKIQQKKNGKTSYFDAIAEDMGG